MPRGVEGRAWLLANLCTALRCCGNDNNKKDDDIVEEQERACRGKLWADMTVEECFGPTVRLKFLESTLLEIPNDKY